VTDGLRFYVALCDVADGLDLEQFPFRILGMEELGIPNWEWMKENYNITELNTAVKPFVFLALFDLHPGLPVIYLDPDIIVTSRLAEVEDAFARGADAVLAPHITEPAEFAEFDDQKFLQFGIYNLGFCAIRDTPQARRVVSWWGRRLERLCVIDLPAGLFVDQKWADLLPAFIDRVHVLRHPGYDVAYWNLSQRRVSRDGDRWLVNGEELRFAHFSGAVIGSPTVFSRHTAVFNRRNIGELSALLAHYEHRLAVNGHAHYRTLPYGYSWGGAKNENLHTPAAVQASRGTEAAPTAHLPVARMRGAASFSDRPPELASARREIELALLPRTEKAFWIRGICEICLQPTEFQVGFMYASERSEDGRLIPNWREHLNCRRCGLTNRVRASLQLFLQECEPARESRLYVTERVTPTFQWLAERFPNIVGSEYFPSAKRSGQLVNGVRHEDLQALSFDDGSFDYLLSFDVLEHVPDHRRAFREAHRTLAPGGKFFFTAPFYAHRDEITVRARMKDDGTIEHLMEPEYHGNPVDPEGGALAFRYFGWEILRELTGLGFREALGLNYWSREYGHLGDPQFVFLARK
jgi:SAM-dependent methyltransferase